MYKINFNKPLHVHFIGIGGISMSGLAEILLKENFTISGSDSKASALTEHLASMGASVFYPQKASNIIDGIDVVVYTAAIHEDKYTLILYNCFQLLPPDVEKVITC
jgi:UDP-N-acetylmuramate--alanine ligase